VPGSGAPPWLCAWSIPERQPPSVEIATGAKKFGTKMFEGFTLPFEPRTFVTRLTFGTPCVGIFLVRIFGPMKAYGFAGPQTVGYMLTDEGFGLRPVVSALNGVLVHHCGATVKAEPPAHAPAMVQG